MGQIERRERKKKQRKVRMQAGQVWDTFEGDRKIKKGREVLMQAGELWDRLKGERKQINEREVRMQAGELWDTFEGDKKKQIQRGFDACWRQVKTFEGERKKKRREVSVQPGDCAKTRNPNTKVRMRSGESDWPVRILISM